LLIFFKKLIVLLAIAGGVGAYAVKFIEENNSKGLNMSNYSFLFPLVFVMAGIIAYVAHKKHWKIADYF